MFWLWACVINFQQYHIFLKHCADMDSSSGRASPLHTLLHFSDTYTGVFSALDSWLAVRRDATWSLRHAAGAYAGFFSAIDTVSWMAVLPWRDMACSV